MIQKVPESNRMDWLQALRGVAALAVLLFHAKDIFANYPAIQKVLAQGFFGVDLFFCLSGYIMCLSCSQKTPGLVNGMHFLSSRFARIYTGYWPALVLTLVAAQVGIRPVTGDWLASVFLTSPLLHSHYLETAWSLVYELRFYLGIGLFYFFFAGRITVRNLTIISSVLIAYHLFYYTQHLNQVHGGEWPLRYVLSGYYLEFLFGMYVYLLNEKIKFKMDVCLFLLPLAMMLLAVGSFNVFFANYEFLRAATYGLSAALILAVFLALQNDGQHAPQRWLVAVGDASYSLYLIHPILLSGLFIALFHYLPQGFLYGFLVLGLLLIVGVSWCWYRWVEKPAYRMSMGLIQRVLPKPPLAVRA